MKKIIFHLTVFVNVAIVPVVSSQNLTEGLVVVQNVTVYQADSLIQAHANDTTFIILDVRTAGEYMTAHLYNAINVDYYSPNFSTIISGFDTSYAYLVYCASGARSALASNIMIGMNFQIVYNMLGGIIQWIAANLPVDSMTTEITGIDKSPVMIDIFPNPCSDILYYNIRDKRNEEYLIALIDFSGKPLIQKKYASSGRSENQFDLTGYPKGLYFVRILGDDYSETMKVLKF